MHTFQLLAYIGAAVGAVVALLLALDLLMRRDRGDYIEREGHCTICSAHVAKTMRGSHD